MELLLVKRYLRRLLTAIARFLENRWSPENTQAFPVLGKNGAWQNCSKLAQSHRGAWKYCIPVGSIRHRSTSARDGLHPSSSDAAVTVLCGVLLTRVDGRQHCSVLLSIACSFVFVNRCSWSAVEYNTSFSTELETNISEKEKVPEAVSIKKQSFRVYAFAAVLLMNL